MLDRIFIAKIIFYIIIITRTLCIYAEKVAVKNESNAVHASSHLAKYEHMPGMQQRFSNPRHWVPRQ